MEEISQAISGVWQWDSGISHHQAQYSGSETENPGELVWTEEISPEDDDRGNGSYTHSPQTLTEFLRSGPHQNPPVAIVEAMLTHLRAQKPPWLDSYRLLMAARSGEPATVQELLAEGVPADVPMGNLTPLYWAVLHQHYAIAEMLLTAGVDVNRHFPGSEETILMTLITTASDTRGEPLAARIIAQGVNLEARKRWGETALMDAARAAYRLPRLVTMLLQAGADVNARSTHGYTALMNSVGYRDAPLSVVNELLDAGAEVNVQDTEGWSALMRAISYSCVAGVRRLLEAGAEIDATTAPKQKYREPRTVSQLADDYANPEIIALIRAARELQG